MLISLGNQHSARGKIAEDTVDFPVDVIVEAGHPFPFEEQILDLILRQRGVLFEHQIVKRLLRLLDLLAQRIILIQLCLISDQGVIFFLIDLRQNSCSGRSLERSLHFALGKGAVPGAETVAFNGRGGGNDLFQFILSGGIKLLQQGGQRFDLRRRFLGFQLFDALCQTAAP